MIDIEYEKALEIGRGRAEEAADIMRRWSGVRAMAVCGLKPDWVKGQWRRLEEEDARANARKDALRVEV